MALVYVLPTRGSHLGGEGGKKGGALPLTLVIATWQNISIHVAVLGMGLGNGVRPPPVLERWKTLASLFSSFLLL